MIGLDRVGMISAQTSGRYLGQTHGEHVKVGSVGVEPTKTLRIGIDENRSRGVVSEDSGVKEGLGIFEMRCRIPSRKEARILTKRWSTPREKQSW